MASPRIQLVLSRDDQAWLKHQQIKLPNFFGGHEMAPLAGDALRIGGRQFIIQARVWEWDGEPVLKLFLSAAHAESDTVFG